MGHCVRLFEGVAVGEDGVDWGLATVRVAKQSRRAEKLTHWFLFEGVAVGEVGEDWGLATVRRPRLRRPGSDALTNVSSFEDSLGREV